MPRKSKKTGTSKAVNESGEKKRTEPLATVNDQALKKRNPFYMVGIGASAGGLEAFETFFNYMPEDSGMAFILVSHLDPSHTSMLPELIQRHTKMRVRQAADGMRVEPNTVYITSPDRELALLNGVLQLLEMVKVQGIRTPIDSFFRSLAQDQREMAVCIVLSGMGSDGSLGLKAIKAELGMAMAQDPASAKYDSMPQAAIATGLVDYTLPPDKMPEQLLAYTRAAGRAITQEVVREGKKADALGKVCVIVRGATGHDFSLYKENTILRRIDRRMAIHQIDDISHYVRFLQHNPHEVELLFKELLIGVTNFFRDPQAFEALEKALTPLLKEKPDNSQVRVWVPGCSTGEEAYSVAMIIRKVMKELHKQFEVQIFATDIDNNAIDMARAGTYPLMISADVPPEWLERHFTKENGFYRINREVREMVVFASQNLIKDPPFTKLDLICCRNVLIYLKNELQQKLIPLFHYSLRPGGILFLGTAETVGGFLDFFQPQDKKWKIYSRKDAMGSKHAVMDFPFTSGLGGEPRTSEQPVKEQITMPKALEQILLEEFVPPSVLVNERGDIVRIHGRTGKYLEPASGAPNLNIVDMAREGLRLQLSSALRKARSRKAVVTYENLRVRVNGGFVTVDMTVKYMDRPESMRGLMLVIFEEQEPSRVKKVAGTHDAVETPGAVVRVRELENELAETKSSLHVTIEELETSNEELKSSNEELQSTNEELQSANEELETSKEEQQSLNEELVTVNSELQGKLEELSITTNDMRNLLNSINVPTIFMDNHLRIKRYTASAIDLFNLISSDVERPLPDISHKLEYSRLYDDLRQVIATLQRREAEVKTRGGDWYNMRISPYRTINDSIDGVVMTFQNINEQKRATQKAEDLSVFNEAIVDTVREALLVLDKDLKIIFANRSFYNTFKEFPPHTEGKTIYDLGNRQWDIPDLKKVLEEILSKDKSFEDFEVRHEFPSIGERRMLLNGRRLTGGNAGDGRILLAIEDVSGRGEA